MHKDFKGWQQKKVSLHYTEKQIPFFNEREIWWCAPGINIGHEQDGKNDNFERPILVFKKFNKDILWALPISSSVIKNNEYYFPIVYKGLNQNVVLSQLRLLSSKRLLRKMGVLRVQDLENIAKKLQGLIKTKPPSADGGISEAEAHCD